MRGRNNDAELRSKKDSQARAGFGTSAAQRLQLGDFRTHGLDDAPATRKRPKTNRHISRKGYPTGRIRECDNAGVDGRKLVFGMLTGATCLVLFFQALNQFS